MAQAISRRSSVKDPKQRPCSAEQGRFRRDDPPCRKTCFDAIHDAFPQRRVRAHPQFHEHDGRQKADGIRNATEDPVRVKLLAQVVNEDIGVEQNLTAYR